MPDEPTNAPEEKKKVLPWYFITRALGVFILLYGILGDHSTDRSTIILTGAGLLGIDKVARSESSKS